MNKVAKRVLIVDDDPSINTLLTSAIGQKFETETVEAGTAAIEYCAQYKPDAIVLDVNLGDMDGREVCQAIKQKYGEQSPPIVFISGDNDEKTILSCFDSGGDDFITKPFSATQIIQKVDSLFRYDTLFRNLKNQSEELSDLVNSTMTQASSYGSLLNTVKNLNHCKSETEIAECAFQYLGSEGLTAAMYFKTPSSSFCVDQKAKICSPIIKEVFELTHNRQRLFKLKNRLVVSDQHVSFLIKNPPQEEEESYGIFIDIMAVLIEALEARYMSYLREKELFSLHKDLTEVIFDLHHGVEDVRNKKQKLVDDIVLRISLSFHELELTEEQEAFFTRMLEDTVMAHDDNNNVIMDLQTRLSRLVSEIDQFVKTEPETPPEVANDDVELF